MNKGRFKSLSGATADARTKASTSPPTAERGLLAARGGKAEKAGYDPVLYGYFLGHAFAAGLPIRASPRSIASSLKCANWP